MKTPLRLLACFASLVVASATLATHAFADDNDEYISIAPSGDSERSKISYGSFGGIERPNPGQYDIRPAAITLRKRAENVAVLVTLVNDGRNAEIRNHEMSDTLTRLIEKADATPGMRINTGRITLSTRNRGMVSSIFSKGNDARFDVIILAALPEGKTTFEITSSLKQFISSIDGVGQTKLIEGSVGLSIAQPERFRQELVKKIADDIHFVRSTLGDTVKMEIRGLDQRISVRQVNDTELELYLNYTYSIQYEGR